MFTLLFSKYDFYISNNFVECDKKENVEVTEADATSCLKERL